MREISVIHLLNLNKPQEETPQGPEIDDIILTERKDHYYYVDAHSADQPLQKQNKSA